MKRRTPLSALAASFAALLALPAAAEPTPIEVAANAVWQHDTAKVRFPPDIDGFRRTSIVDYGDQRFDVSARYFDEESRTTATLYLFRAPLPDVALWHDRALVSIRQHEALGTPDHSAAVTAAFAPPTSEVASGLLTVMPLSGRAARSTALAVFPQGPWLVKVRMTSDGLDPAQLRARLETLLASLSLDALETAQSAAVAIAPCADRLAFSEAARAARPKGAVMLALAMNSAVADDVKAALPDLLTDEDRAQADSPFCRDAASQGGYGVYRRVGAEERYVIGFGDAGLSAIIGKNPVAKLLAEPGSEAFLVSFANPYKISFYRGFETLPTPAQAIAVIDGEQALSSFERTADGNSKINIVPD